MSQEVVTTRPGAPRSVTLAGVVALLAVLMVGVGAVVARGHGAPASRANDAGRASAAGGAAGTAAAASPVGSLSRTIASTQARLRSRPADSAGWALLGTAYVEQARLSGDPSYYPKADEALKRALAVPASAHGPAYAGLAVLADARHDFAHGRDWARRALEENPRDPQANAALVDALTQLGDYPGALASAQRMLDLRPDVTSYTRASYVEELRGDVPAAREALARALAAAGTPADQAYCRQYLGELAFSTGTPAEALRQYRLGLAADPASPALLAAAAKAEAATGAVPAALRDYATATARMPLPQYLLEYAELLEASGRTAQAKAQYQLVAEQQKLFAAGGVTDEAFLAEFEADHGSPAAAVAHARAEWARRHSVQVADAYGWALYRAGRPAEAMTYAKTATALGWRNPLLYYHRGMIAAALGQRDAARRDLTAALAGNPAFSPLRAPRARATLASLGGGR